MAPPHVNFAVSGSSHEPFYGMYGSFHSVFGSKVDKSGSDIPGTDQRLYTIIFLTPGMTGNESKGSSMGSSARFHDMTLSQGVDPKQVQVKVKWDKAEDVFKIDDQKFDRSRGDIFIVEKSLKGSARVWQLDASSAMQDSKDILAFAKAQLPDLESLKLATSDVEEYMRLKRENKEND